MSKYTTTLSRIIESGFDLGLDKYPIFDELYRTTLNDKIIEHYWENEIGKETAYSFKFALNRALNEIMPRYNKMYKAELLEINPLLSFGKSSTGIVTKDSETIKDQDSTTVKDQDSSSLQTINNTTSLDNTTTSNTNDVSNVENDVSQSTNTNNVTNQDTSTSNNTTSVTSDTPQDEILIGNLESNLYASEANVNRNSVNVDDNTTVDESSNVVKDENTKTTTDSTTTNVVDTDSKSDTTNDTATSLDDTTTISLDDKTTSSESQNSQNDESGFDRPLSELIMLYRESLIDVDTLVIHDPKIRECFMMIY